MGINISANLPTATAAGVTLYGQEHHGLALVPFVIHERVSPAGGASGSPTDLNQKLPPHTFLTAYSIKAVGDHTIATATHVSIGTDSDPDAFAELAEGSLDADNDWLYGRLSTAANTAEDGLRITATNGSGAAAGTLTGSYDVTLYGYRFRETAD